jgi:anti-sigma B factor antagonist
MQFQVTEQVGILDGTTANVLRQKIRDVLQTPAPAILIDLSQTTFVNSSGLGALVSMLKMVRSHEKELYLCSLNEQVKMIFELTRMGRVFKTFQNRSEFEQKMSTLP